MRGSSGVGHLAQVFRGAMGDTVQQANAIPWLDLAVVQDDLSLLSHKFRVPIPLDSYSRLRPDTLLDPMTVTLPAVTGSASVGDHGGHTHVQNPQDVVRPPDLAPLVAGDTVLIAWVLDRAQAVVIGVVDTS